MPPPMVARSCVAGSIAYISPCVAAASLSVASTKPGCTRAQPSPASISRTRAMWREKSSTIAWLIACPARLVPAPRGSTGKPRRAAMRTTACTSAASRGKTTPTGLHLVDGGVGRVEQARRTVERQLA